MHQSMRLIIQLALVILFGRAFGILCSRCLKQPSVLGELAAGMIFGPYALGGIALPFLGGEPLCFAVGHCFYC